MVTLATLLASAAGVLAVVLQIVARVSPYMAPGHPTTVGYATSSCQGLAFSLWFPTQPRPALPYFSYLQAQSARPAPPWVVPGRVGRILAALTLALGPYIFRSTKVGSTSLAHWRRHRKSCSRSGNQLDRHVSVGAGGLVIMIQGFEAFTFIAAELCEALASRGFAVAAIDLAQHEAVEARLAAVTALLDHILSEHSEHVDPDRVVVVGHSRGGSQAAHLALSDPRVRGAVLLHSNVGDMQTLMRAQPVPSGSRAPTALLVVHALDDRAVRADNHIAWANLLDEHTQSSDIWRWHALVDAPCGHDGCTSLHTMLSFAMPRWIFETLSCLSNRISALRTLCPVGVTEPRARQLVTITSRYVCDFAEAVLTSKETRQLRARAQGLASPAPARSGDDSGAGMHSMELFEDAALWLHEAGFWRLRTTSADSNGGMRDDDDRGGRRVDVQPDRPAQAQVQMQDAGVVQQLHASI